MRPSRQDIEIILTRQLASYLSTPVFVVDLEGTLVFYNEPAEAILGHRFEDTGEMSAAEWSTVFYPTNADGSTVPPHELPLMIALTEERPAHLNFWIKGLDGQRRHVEVIAFPLVPQQGQLVGAVAIFWGQTAT